MLWRSMFGNQKLKWKFVENWISFILEFIIDFCWFLLEVLLSTLEIYSVFLSTWKNHWGNTKICNQTYFLSQFEFFFYSALILYMQSKDIYVHFCLFQRIMKLNWQDPSRFYLSKCSNISESFPPVFGLQGLPRLKK